MAPLSAAERAKRYREKNKNRVQEMDALRKRHMRTTMKVTSPNENKERLLRQRLYKQEYRKKKAITNNSPSTSTSSSTDLLIDPQRSGRLKRLKRHCQKVQANRRLLSGALHRSSKSRFFLRTKRLRNPNEGERKMNLMIKNLAGWKNSPTDPI